MKKKTNVEKVEELMKKRAQENEEQKQESKPQKVKEPLDQVVYTVIVDKEKGGNNFLIAKIAFNYETKDARVESISELSQKVIGMRFPVEQENLKYYYEKNKKIGDQ